MTDLILVPLDPADAAELLELLDHTPTRGLTFDHRSLIPRVRAALEQAHVIVPGIWVEAHP